MDVSTGSGKRAAGRDMQAADEALGERVHPAPAFADLVPKLATEPYTNITGHRSRPQVRDLPQVTLDRALLGDRAAYLQEGMVVTVRSFDGQPLSVSIPDTVALEVVEADPVVKGQTAASSYKPARLENGLRVMVPPHIESGTRIVVNTNDGSYVARAKD